jgi:hypothetical protein
MVSPRCPSLTVQRADFGWMTGYPEFQTDGRGGAAMIWPGETEAGCGDATTLRDSLVVVSMPRKSAPEGWDTH